MSNTVAIITNHGRVGVAKSLGDECGPEAVLRRLYSGDRPSNRWVTPQMDADVREGRFFARLVDIDYTLEWWVGRPPAEPTFFPGPRDEKTLRDVIDMGGIVYTELKWREAPFHHPNDQLPVVVDWNTAYERWRTAPRVGVFGDAIVPVDLTDVRDTVGRAYATLSRKRKAD